MAINEIIGNSRVLDRLRAAVKRDELSHAYIFEGADGIGKKTIATEFAAMIMCLSEEDIPCGLCSSCLKIASGNHPDLFLESPSKREYTVEDISNIQGEMRRKPNESSKKVFIIDRAERLSVKSQNKFLKTIEEPPENVITIILVNNINKLLKTTVSRCQPIKIEKVEHNGLREYFKNIGYSQGQIELALSFADGNIGRAKKLVEDENFNDSRDKVIGIVDDIIFKDKTKIFNNTKFFEENKDSIDILLDLMQTWFRDIMILKRNLGHEHIINRDSIETLKTQSEKLPTNKIYDIVKRIEDTKKDIDRNVNYQLSIEMLLLNIV